MCIYLCPGTSGVLYLENAYLNRREWVLQERILTPRILCYGKTQLFWECNEFRARKSFPEGVYGSGITKPNCDT